MDELKTRINITKSLLGGMPYASPHNASKFSHGWPTTQVAINMVLYNQIAIMEALQALLPKVMIMHGEKTPVTKGECHVYTCLCGKVFETEQELNEHIGAAN